VTSGSIAAAEVRGLRGFFTFSSAAVAPSVAAHTPTTSLAFLNRIQAAAPSCVS
jgi:hypothetical protein